jgi:hypothetical protein
LVKTSLGRQGEISRLRLYGKPESLTCINIRPVMTSKHLGVGHWGGPRCINSIRVALTLLGGRDWLITRIILEILRGLSFRRGAIPNICDVLCDNVCNIVRNITFWGRVSVP